MDVSYRLRVLFSTMFVPALCACGDMPSNESATFPEISANCATTAIPHQYMVRYKDGSISVEHAKSRKDLIEKVIKPNEELIEFVEQDQYVHSAELKRDVNVSQVTAPPPNDWGQTMTQASDAWAAGYEGQGVIVAIVDSGMATTHAQLHPNLYVNNYETPGNHVDDDFNGYVDDVNGWDFYAKSPVVGDANGHGTHVSGIIGAKHSAGPILGIAQRAKLLPLGFMDADGSGAISDAVSAIKYATRQHAQVINASWGGAPCSVNLQNAMLAFNGLVIVAAGNEGVNIETSPTYPASFGLSNQVTVAASKYYVDLSGNPHDIMDGSYSNYSYKLVNIMAPGTNIVSTYPPNTTMNLSGTSMATPFVSGAAAVLWSAKPNATPAQIKAALIAGVDTGNIQVSSRGRLNIKKALDAIIASVP